jgi:predicted adenine nucleotide alpha hydrolase (AANH) superfamily ATPase
VKVLLHICCGPCASYPLPDLLDQGHSVSGFFYNPNIHPYTEYQKRKAGAEALAAYHDVPIIAQEEYDPAAYFQAVAFREQHRCRLCYQLRLERTVQIARKGKFDAFTTSLLVSPYQKHELIKETGLHCAEKYGVPFLYQDWRPHYSDTVTRSRELNLYRQPYCGCLYSEWERYRGKDKEGRA